MFKYLRRIKKPTDISATFCAMPWINIATETNGKCKICCLVMDNNYIKKDDGSDFLLQNDPIEDIWNSKYLKQVRKKMLDGEWVSDCSYCKNQEDLKQTSGRDSFNSRFFDQKLYSTVIDSKKNNGHVIPLPTSIEIRPGILCNLKCNTCWSLSSSKIYAERKDIIENGFKYDLPDFLIDSWKGEVQLADQSDFNWSEKTIYLDNIEKCLPNLKRIYLTGGEPTLIKSNLAFLKKLLALGKKDVLISFTTNLQQFPDEWLSVLSQFDHVDITASIDGYKEATEYIRYPSQWTRIYENLNKIYALYPKVSLTILSVIQVANVFEYVDLVKWVADEYTNPQLQVIPTMLQNPDFLRIDILPSHIKSTAISYINDVLMNSKISLENKNNLNNLLLQIKSDNPKSQIYLNQFYDYIKYLDASRNTNFNEAFPKMKNLFNAF